jgi:DNA-binding MarR family transcriptional regulator
MSVPAQASEEADGGPQVQPRVSYLVARLERAIRRTMDEQLKEYGLTVPQYVALWFLREREGLSNAQLARRCLVAPQSMSEVILALESGGYIRRAPDMLNRRILRTVLTPRGEEVLAACDNVVEEMERTMVGRLAPSAQERFASDLLACVHNLGAGF